MPIKLGRLDQQLDSSILTLPQLFAKVEKSVVQITGRIGTSSNLPESGIRLGSGFVYDNNGHIITNNHVAEGNQDLDVTFLDGTIYRAESNWIGAVYGPCRFICSKCSKGQIGSVTFGKFFNATSR